MSCRAPHLYMSNPVETATASRGFALPQVQAFTLSRRARRRVSGMSVSPLPTMAFRIIALGVGPEATSKHRSASTAGGALARLLQG